MDTLAFAASTIQFAFVEIDQPTAVPVDQEHVSGSGPSGGYYCVIV